jgi:hypothetical protein
LQLWILQIKSEKSIENRVVCGRLLPYTYSSDSWSGTDDDNFRAFGHVQAQVARLNLYVKSTHCVELLRQLSAGRTVSAITEKLKFGLSGRDPRFVLRRMAPVCVLYFDSENESPIF